MFILKQSTAVDVLIGPFVDKTDGVTAETGESPTVKLSKNGQTLAAKNDATTPVHDADGYYNCELDTTDTNTVGTLALSVAASANAAPVRHEFMVVEESVYDNFYAASAVGPLTAAQVNAEADTALTDFFTSPATLVDLVWDEVLSGATHNVAQSAGRRLRQLQDSGVYALGAVWVDEVAGTSTGTTNYEDATVTNRANDFDNAQTVADSVGVNSVQVSNGNSITLTAGLEGYNVVGNGSALALGGQNVGGTIIRQFGQITGIGTSTGNPIFFEDNLIGAVTLAPSVLQRCGIGLSSGTFTVGSAGDFIFIDCYSRVAGSGAPVVDLGGAVGATTLEFRRWSGGLTLNNVAAGDVVSVDVVSGGTITVNGTGGTVVVRGHCNVVDGSSGSVTITETSVVNMTKINTEADTAISDAALATAAALATVDSNVDAILVDTGTTIPATLGTPVADLATDIATVDSNVDAILVDTGTTLPATLGTPAGADLATDIATVDSNVDSVKTVTDALTAGAATKLKQSMEGVIVGTATGGTTSTVTSAVTGHGDDTFNGRLMVMRSGTLQYEAGIITDYDSTAGTFTFAASTWTTSPTTETFIIL